MIKQEKNSNHICDVHIKLFHDNNLLMYNWEISLSGLNFLRNTNRVVSLQSSCKVCEFLSSLPVLCFSFVFEIYLAVLLLYTKQHTVLGTSKGNYDSK